MSGISTSPPQQPAHPERDGIFRSDGVPVRLLDRIARGGEGAVYAIENVAGQVAKVYHNRLSAQQQRKLRLMPRMATAELVEHTGWPILTLHDGLGGPAIGFVQRYFPDAAPLHELYGPRSQRRVFPRADWEFLVRAARNVARSVAGVHDRGLVIGDLNPTNVLVTQQAATHLIDCDSYQFEWKSEWFGCAVAMPEFAAPELHGRELAVVVRTEQHDAFALSVLIFQLLFSGRHPFADAMRDEKVAEPSLITAIRNGRFGAGRSRRRGEPRYAPPGPGFDDVPSDVKHLFERALNARPWFIGKRPAARRWVAALDALLANLKHCGKDPAHVYFNGAASCPWCNARGVGAPIASTYFADVAGAVAVVRTESAAQGVPAAQIVADPPAVRAPRRHWLFQRMAASTGLRARAQPWLRNQLTRSRETSLEWFCATSDYEEATRFSDYFRTLAELRTKLASWEACTAGAHTIALTDASISQQVSVWLEHFAIADGEPAGLQHLQIAQLEKLDIHTLANADDDRLYEVEQIDPSLALALYRWRTTLERLAAVQLVPQELLATGSALICANLERELVLGAQRLIFERQRAHDLERAAMNRVTALVAQFSRSKAEQGLLMQLVDRA